jgi:hypothetical protein
MGRTGLRDRTGQDWTGLGLKILLYMAYYATDVPHDSLLKISFRRITMRVICLHSV